MRNRDRWKPSKYVIREGKLRASLKPSDVSVGSRLVADTIARCYGANLPQHCRGKLLDLGCGKVPLYVAYKDLVTDVTCVDWENTLHKNEYLDREVDLTKDLPFGDREFDTVILSDVLEHIPVPERLFGEMARVLADNGKLIVNVPFYYRLHEEPHDYYRYTEFALRRFVEVSGLRLVHMEATGGAPEIVADTVAKNALRFKYVGAPLARFVQWSTQVLLATGFGKRFSDRTAKQFPLGYFVVAQKAGR